LNLAKIAALEEKFEKSGLTIKQLQDGLTYKAELESMGFTVDALSKVATAAKIHGKGSNRQPDKVIEAIAAYGINVTIKEDTEKALAKLDATKRQCEAIEKVAQSTKQENERMAGEIKLVKEIRALGFEKTHLARIKEISEKMTNESLLLSSSSSSSLSSSLQLKQGEKPVDQVLNGLDQYNSVAKHQNVLANLQEETAKAREEANKQQKETDRRRGIIEICDKLVEKGFSAVMIQQIYDSASVYGEPLQVLKAGEDHGRGQSNQLKISEQEKEIARNDARIQEGQKQIARTEGEWEAIEASIRNHIEPLVLSVQQRVTESIENISKTYTDHATKIQQTYRTYGKWETTALQFNRELKMARIFIMVQSFPDGARLIHPEFAVQLVDTLAKFCRIHEINLQTCVPRELFKDKQGYDTNYIDFYPLMILLKGHLERHVESIANRTATNTMTASKKE